MSFNNQHLDVDGYEADRRMHAEKDDRLWDKPEALERIYLNKNEIGQYLLWMDKESDEDIEYIRADIHQDSLKAIDLMIKDRDAFHDKNVELEKKLMIANKKLRMSVKTLRIIDRIGDEDGEGTQKDLIRIFSEIELALTQLEGEGI